MMRVALLGAANSIHLQRWAHGLVARGHTLCVLTQDRIDRALLPQAAEVIALPYGGASGYFANAWHVRRFLRDWRPDILNAHYASGYGTTAALAGAKPLLLSVWGSDVYDFPYQGLLQAMLIRFNLRRATAIASTSRAMANQVRRLVPGVGGITVTPFGVDLTLFSPRPMRDANWITLGIVKTLAPKYGVDLLLRAFAGLISAELVRALPVPCRLLIVGDGPQRMELEALANELGVAGRVFFSGAVAHPEVPDWLNRLDVYAAPSRSESFGVAVIEAGACGVPVVVSDVGGLPEVVLDGETGLVVQRESVSALQAALARLVLDPALRTRLGARGREHVSLVYDWPRCVDAMEAAYARTIAAHREAGH